MLRLAVADLDSPSYFVATAAVELGFFKEEGIDITLDRVFGAADGPERLREGSLHFFGGPAYAATRAFPGWAGAKLLCALAQYSYWFMAVRADLNLRRGDVAALKGLRIASSLAFPVMGLKYLLAQSGIDLERDRVRIVPARPLGADKHAMGRSGVDAILNGAADAYWGNGMRLAIGEKLGVAKLHLDLRRGDGPPGARFYNFAALTVIGEPQPLGAVESLDTEPIDLSGATGPITRQVSVLPPAGVTLARAEPLSVTVQVAALSLRQTLPVPVSVQGVGSDLFVASDVPIVNVTASGPADQGLSASDVRATVDASGLGEGTATLPVHVTLPDRYQLEQVSPASVRVVLQAANSAGPTATAAPTALPTAEPTSAPPTEPPPAATEAAPIPLATATAPPATPTPSPTAPATPTASATGTRTPTPTPRATATPVRR